jgi:hypothetical protein
VISISTGGQKLRIFISALGINYGLHGLGRVIKYVRICISKCWLGTFHQVFDATITFFAALAARDPRTLIEVAQQEGFVPTLVEILSSFDYSKDLLASVLASRSDDDLKSHGVLRTEIIAVSVVLEIGIHARN